MGQRGFLLANSQNKEIIANYKVKAVDSTAAGDAFMGGLAYGIASGKSVKDAALFANAVAAFSVTRIGAQLSMPTKAQVEVFVKNLS